MPGRILTLPLYQSLRLRKQLHSFCALLHCHAHPWERGGWGNFAGREGEQTAWNDDDVGLEMKWLAFYILYTVAFLRTRGEHILLFTLLFAFWILLCSLHSLLWKSKRKSDQAWKRWNPRRFLGLLALKNRRTLKSICAPPLRLKRNVCGLWRMFAPNFCASREMFAAVRHVTGMVRITWG